MKKTAVISLNQWAIWVRLAFFVFLILALIFVIYSGISLAAGSGASTPSSLYDWVYKLLYAVSGLIGVLAVAVITIGGIMYATSAGNQKQISTAKEMIISAISGVVLYILSLVLLGNFAGGQNVTGIIGKLFPPPPITNSGSSSGGNSGSSSGGQYYHTNSPAGF